MSEDPDLPSLRDLLAASVWRRPLTQFAKTTGLAVLAVDSAGVVLVGPVSPTPLADTLRTAGLWGDDSGTPLAAPVAAAIDESVRTGVLVQTRLADVLAIAAIPIVHDTGVAGCVVAGGVYHEPPSPAAIDRLATLLAIDAATLRDGLAAERPLAVESFTVYVQLLGHQVAAVLRERVEALRERAEADRLRQQAGVAAARLATLEQATRDKDEFLAVLSHELRTPLTPILGWTRLLRLGTLDHDRTQVLGALLAIERNAEQELQIVDEMLDFSRLVTNRVQLELERVHPSDTLAAALAAVHPLMAGRDLRLQLDAADDLPYVRGDSRRLQQILMNLLTNAVKFTGDGGTVTLGARREGDDVTISVSDTGIGLADDELASLFDRLGPRDSSTTRAPGDLGIGLAVVKGLVRLHGGNVSAHSAGPGRGATFVVRLPALEAQAEPETAVTSDRADVVEASRTAERRILLVEDDPDSLALLDFMLQLEGFEVRSASSVDEATAILSAWRPDVIVSDIGMPTADGFELVRRVRAQAEQLGHLPVLALTGFASAADRSAALAGGFDAHVPKPVDPDVLLQTLRRLIVA